MRISRKIERDSQEKDVQSFHLTPMSDISANMFAAFLLMLLALFSTLGSTTALRSGVTPPPPSAATISKRQIVPAAQAVQMLYDRLHPDDHVSIDVHDRGVLLLSGANSRWLDSSNDDFDAEVDAFLARAQRGDRDAIQVFVIAHGAYRSVSRVLTRGRRSFREISVPDALCATDRSDWSRDYLSLKASARSPAEFKVALTRLLTTHRGRELAAWTWRDEVEALVAAGGFGAPMDRAGPLQLLQHALAWLAWAARLSGVATLLAFVVWIEMRNAPRA
jgi:hypothetical protein